MDAPLEKGANLTAPRLEVLAVHLTQKVHTWRGKYYRLFVFTPTQVLNVDPSNFEVRRDARVPAPVLPSFWPSCPRSSFGSAARPSAFSQSLTCVQPLGARSPPPSAR